MSIFIPGSFQGSAAQALVRLAQVAARPNFELQFSIAQNTALDRLDKEIQAFQDSNFGQGKTALLRIKVARLERQLEAANAFKEIVTSNRLTTRDLLDQLGEMRALADPSTVAEFEAKQDAVLETLDKLRTAVTATNQLGAPDDLGKTKQGGLTDIEAIVHNNFATAADIQDVQDTIDNVAADLSASLTIIEINRDIATNTVASADRSLGEAKFKIDEIVVAERKRQIDKIQELHEQTARILTSVSLAFEAAQFMSDYIAQNTVLPQKIEPGSVLNLFA